MRRVLPVRFTYQSICEFQHLWTQFKTQARKAISLLDPIHTSDGYATELHVYFVFQSFAFYKDEFPKCFKWIYAGAMEMRY